VVCMRTVRSPIGIRRRRSGAGRHVTSTCNAT
jgi:hypothetical protein